MKMRYIGLVLYDHLMEEDKDTARHLLKATIINDFIVAESKVRGAEAGAPPMDWKNIQHWIPEIELE